MSDGAALIPPVPGREADMHNHVNVGGSKCSRAEARRPRGGSKLGGLLKG